MNKELLGLDNKSFDALVYSVADTIDEDEIHFPRMNRKYANKRKHLLKDKQGLLAYATEDKSILTDEGIFYGKMLQGWKARSAFHGKKFIGMTQKEYWNHDYKYVTSRIDAEFKLRMDEFCKREAFQETPISKRHCQSLYSVDWDINDEGEDEDFELSLPVYVEPHIPVDHYWMEKVESIYHDYVREMNAASFYDTLDEYEYWDNY